MNKLNDNINSAISSLEWAIARNNHTPRSSDEFTAKEFSENTNISQRTSLQILDNMVQEKLLSSRKMPVNGKSTNLYKKCCHQE
jgi:DNA-binding IscR family transcriptional regulator